MSQVHHQSKQLCYHITASHFMSFHIKLPFLMKSVMNNCCLSVTCLHGPLLGHYDSTLSNEEGLRTTRHWQKQIRLTIF